MKDKLLRRITITMAKDRDKFIADELKEIRNQCEGLEGIQLVTCVPDAVAMIIKKTDFKQLKLRLMFPSHYPNEPIISELNSKTLSEKLLDGLQKVCDDECKKFIGNVQVMKMLHFVNKFLEDHKLCVCSSEIAYVKKELLKDCDEVKLRQKTSQIIIKAQQDKYFLNFKLTIPEDYPKTQVQLEIIDHNFPELLKVNFEAQAVEYARQCVQPPLRKKPGDPPFQPKPSMLPVCKYLIGECVKNYPLQKCPMCFCYVLPQNPPEEVSKEKQVERVYCGHLYHHSCLAAYMKKPPFIGGKKCPACGKRIFHEKWKITPELAEARWAHKQARDRELEEVKDFMA